MITFTLHTDDIMDNVKSVSAERGKALLLKANQSAELQDEAILDDSDDTNIRKYMLLGASRISGALAAYTENLLDDDGVTELDAYEFVDADPLADPVVEESIVLRINEPTTFITANEVVVFDLIKEMITNYILYRTYKNKGHDFESFNDDYETSKINMLNFVSQRSAPVHRAYNLF